MTLRTDDVTPGLLEQARRLVVQPYEITALQYVWERNLPRAGITVSLDLSAHLMSRGYVEIEVVEGGILKQPMVITPLGKAVLLVRGWRPAWMRLLEKTDSG